MVSFLASLAVVVLFATLVYRYAPHRDLRAAELFERYRPHSPMSDWSLAYTDDRRQHDELAVIRAHRECERENGRSEASEPICRSVRGVRPRAVQF
ncbi:hypothetical protein [Nocardia blacklockiae]|uniref:hypothetical protein n=1 Tax=Nocardia blacklockiae TaxID=480036 RepID=UPI0018962D62|nr:hypothetical protein [Nocardia blacklockiae]MBF6175443.1 hypothetical protein [Nocardia blacklockiae]